jgi:hypothetical protein
LNSTTNPKTGDDSQRKARRSTIPTAHRLTPDEVHQLKAALDAVTIGDLWRLIGLPGYRNLPADRDDYQCLSPFRDEDRASFSIFDNGRRWKDWGAGGDQHGDQVDFLQRATGLEMAVASRFIIAFAQTIDREDQPDEDTYDPLTDELKANKRTTWPPLEIPNQTEINKIAAMRGLSPEGLEIAIVRGYLRCATYRETRVWIITDKAGYAAQARRMDGKPWEHLQNAKAISLRGSVGTWPVGITPASVCPAIALVEGGPDLLAAIDLATITNTSQAIASVAMFGSSISIKEQVLDQFTDKRVRIFAHADIAGQNAGRVWADQLISVGCEVSGYPFEGLKLDGQPVGDLNDFLNLLPQNPTQEDIDRIGGLFLDAVTF